MVTQIGRLSTACHLVYIHSTEMKVGEARDARQENKAASELLKLSRVILRRKETFQPEQTSALRQEPTGTLCLSSRHLMLRHTESGQGPRRFPSPTKVCVYPHLRVVLVYRPRPARELPGHYCLRSLRFRREGPSKSFTRPRHDNVGVYVHCGE